MFKIIGGDQKEYGPIGVEEVRRWISEGRLNGRSLAWVEGSPEWKPLSSFPEFSETLRLQSGQASPPFAGGSPAAHQAWTSQLLATRPALHIGECLSRSLDLMKENLGLLFGACFVVWLVESICQRLPIVGMLYWVLQGVVNAGLYLIFLNRIRGKPASVGEVFSGFSSGFPQLLLAGMITTLLSGIGWLFCMLPGIYLMVAWIFAIPLVVDKKLEFWTAMETSRKVVTRVWFEVLGLIILAFLPLILVNIFATVKVSMVVFPIAMDMINSGKFDPSNVTSILLQLAKTALPLWIITRLVLLLNLPFAMGALMYGYESLFGSRETGAA
jgi:hypothetical protein